MSKKFWQPLKVASRRLLVETVKNSLRLIPSAIKLAAKILKS